MPSMPLVMISYSYPYTNKVKVVSLDPYAQSPRPQLDTYIMQAFIYNGPFSSGVKSEHYTQKLHANIHVNVYMKAQ